MTDLTIPIESNLGKLSTVCHYCKMNNLCSYLQKKAKLKDVVHSTSYKRNSHVTLENTPVSKFYLVKKGVLKSYITYNEREKIVDFVFPGEIGGLSNLSNTHAKNGLYALSDLSICEIDAAYLRELIMTDTYVSEAVIALLSSKIDEQQLQFVVYSSSPADVKVATFIHFVYKKSLNENSNSSNIKLNMSRSDIANYLNLTIETVSRVLTKLAKLNYISVKGTHIMILDIENLENYN